MAKVEEAGKRPLVFRSARIFDGDSDALIEGRDVVVAGGVIEDVAAPDPRRDKDAEVIDCSGCVLMPGLIDAHVHVYAAGLNITRVVQSPMSYLAHFAAKFLHGCLDRGFTTVRDVGGADVGLASAIRDGLLGTVRGCFTGAA